MRLFWTKYRIVFTLQTAQEQGRLFPKAVDNRNLYRAARERFGDWGHALKVAGLDCPEPWSTDRVIRQIEEYFPLRGEDVWKDLGLAVATERLFESCDQALQAAGFEIEHFSRSSKWDRNAVRQAIHDRFHRGMPLDSQVANRDPQLDQAACCYFGNWDHALVAAELERLSRTWPKSLILETIRERHQQRGSLRCRDDPELSAMCVKQFGGWRKALMAAGLEVEIPQKWTQELVLQELRKLKSHKLSGIGRKAPRLYAAVLRYFGSLPNAITRAGLDHKPRMRWSQKRVFEELHLWHQRSGRNHTRMDHCLRVACRQQFGTVRKALKAAGLEPLPRGKWSKERVIEAIQNRHVRGLQLEQPFKADHALAVAAIRFFGDWPSALKASGLGSKVTPGPSRRQQRQWTRQELVSEIQSRHRKGLSMAYSQNPDLIRAARRHFGGWVAAKQSAGLGPICQPWTPERILAEVRAYYHRLPDSILPQSREFDCLRTVAWRHFGSWANAIAAADLDEKDIPCRVRT